MTNPKKPTLTEEEGNGEVSGEMLKGGAVEKETKIPAKSLVVERGWGESPKVWRGLRSYKKKRRGIKKREGSTKIKGRNLSEKGGNGGQNE